MKIHGIAITYRKTGKLLEFKECDYGRAALGVLCMVRLNMDQKFKAEETIMELSEIRAAIPDFKPKKGNL